MIETIHSLLDTPIPTIFIVSGTLLLFFAIGVQFQAVFTTNVKPSHAAVLGSLFLILGLALHALPFLVKTSEPTTSEKTQNGKDVFFPNQLNVLWVDDLPKTKVDLYGEVEKLGGNVRYIGENDLAIELLKKTEFTHIISDIGRLNFDGGDAGLRLIEAVREIDPDIPIFILSSHAEKHEKEAYKLGATFVTDEGNEVLTRLIGITPYN